MTTLAVLLALVLLLFGGTLAAKMVSTTPNVLGQGVPDELTMLIFVVGFHGIGCVIAAAIWHDLYNEVHFVAGPLPYVTLTLLCAVGVVFLLNAFFTLLFRGSEVVGGSGKVFFFLLGAVADVVGIVAFYLDRKH